MSSAKSAETNFAAQVRKCVGGKKMISIAIGTSAFERFYKGVKAVNYRGITPPQRIRIRSKGAELTVLICARYAHVRTTYRDDFDFYTDTKMLLKNTKTKNNSASYRNRRFFLFQLFEKIHPIFIVFKQMLPILYN